jgi:hypothetical protein
MDVHFFSSRLFCSRRLVYFAVILFITMVCPQKSSAHQAPYSLAWLDVAPSKVGLELHVPLPELELAFGNKITSDPEHLLGKMGTQLREYFLSHTHAYVNRNALWLLTVQEMNVVREQQESSGPPFWELRIHMILQPQKGENTRNFFLDYDGVVHQVANHIIFVAVRSDWETGRKDSVTADSDPMTIRMDGDNTVHPLHITISKGSWVRGFSGMISLGMEHIKEGTDHLLFLLVLLLPAMLLVNRKEWGRFGGTHYSFIRLLKIITAFTVGHSITLLLGAIGWLQLPSQPVEILIAVSILVSAIHAIKPVFAGKEVYIAAGFGLIHGSAFAGVIANLNLNAGAMGISILGFNIGIELMQLLVIVIVVPWLIILSRTTLYTTVRITGAGLSGIVASAWIIERVTGNENFVSAFVKRASPHGVWGIVTLGAFAVIVYINQRKNKWMRH